MGFLDETVNKVSDMWEALRSKSRHKKHMQLQTVEIKVRIDCEGCEKKVKDAVKGMKGVTEVVVDPKKHKLTVTGYVEPEKVLKRVTRKTGKKAELWPYVPYTLVDHPYVPGVYDKKAPPGYVRSAAAVNPATSELARASPEEERYASAFSDENPNACALMYQSPLPPDQVKPLVDFDYEGDNSSGVRGRGRSGRGRGRGRGFANMTNDYEDAAWDNRGRGYGRGGWAYGRGRSFRGRGRGGYGGGYNQHEAGGYDDEAPFPAQGRGFGRGRGRFRGRGRDFGAYRQNQRDGA